MTIVKFINEVGFKVREGDVKKVNGTISDIKSTATKLLGAIGIGFSLTKINALVEEFGRVNEQVKNSTAALGDQAEIQKKIMESARQTRSSYAETAGVISDLVHESPELFGNIDEAVKFNNAATMLFKSAGKTNEDIAGLTSPARSSSRKRLCSPESSSARHGSARNCSANGTNRRTEEADSNAAQPIRSRSPSSTTPRTRSGWCRWTTLRRWSDELLRNLRPIQR